MINTEQESKNKEMKCQNPNCNNKTNSTHSRYCQKCSIRHTAKSNGYVLDEKNVIDLGDKVGYILKRKIDREELKSQLINSQQTKNSKSDGRKLIGQPLKAEKLPTKSKKLSTCTSSQGETKTADAREGKVKE